MNRKALVLLSGGLDSTLAAHIVKAQGIEVEAVNFQTLFGCCKNDAGRIAHEIGIGITVLKVGDDYLDLIRNPKHGYGRGMNPCVDCRGYMFAMTRSYMERTGASFLISGEVLGQRPMSQKRSDFRKIDRDTGLAGLIVRPLSAKLLEPTLPEQAGILDREKLYDIQGRSRARLLELARRFGVEDPPAPSSGCALTSPEFSKKVRDLFENRMDYERWEFEVLKMGRHFRLDEKTKIILGRSEDENAYFQYLHPKGITLMVPVNYAGPCSLFVGERREEAVRRAAAIMLRYAHKPLPEAPETQLEYDGAVEQVRYNAVATDAEVDEVRIV